LEPLAAERAAPRGAAGAGVGGRVRPRLPIFMFHALDGGSDVCALAPDVFRRGLVRLAGRGFRTQDLAAATGALSTGTEVSPRTVCLTFDDGYASVYTDAFPALQVQGMTATVFLTVGARDGRHERLPSLQGREMLSWSEIREMAAAGIAFGAHACLHRDLTRLTAREVEDEMAGSKAVIEDRLGMAVRGFAYPFGRFDASSRAIARRHFAFACADTLGIASASSDPWALPRVETYYLRGRRGLALIASPWLGTYLLARRGPRAVRRAIEGPGRRV